MLYFTFQALFHQNTSNIDLDYTHHIENNKFEIPEYDHKNPDHLSPEQFEKMMKRAQLNDEQENLQHQLHLINVEADDNFNNELNFVRDVQRAAYEPDKRKKGVFKHQAIARVGFTDVNIVNTKRSDTIDSNSNPKCSVSDETIIDHNIFNQYRNADEQVNETDILNNKSRRDNPDDFNHNINTMNTMNSTHGMSTTKIMNDMQYDEFGHNLHAGAGAPVMGVARMWGIYGQYQGESHDQHQ